MPVSDNVRDPQRAGRTVDSPSSEKKYIAKLSDFGSIILLDEAQKSNQHIQYHSTNLTNAPETLEQSGKNTIPVDMLVRCDIYSLGLLYLQVLAGDLNTAWTSKNEKVLENAENFIQQCPELTGGMTAAICVALEQLLPYHAEDRCADLSVVLNLLKSFKLSDITDMSLNDIESIPIGRSNAEIAKAVERNFGFGVKGDVDLALKSILEAARKDYLPAQAILHVWYAAHSQAVDIDEETQLDWLYNACLWGSVYAGPVLQQKSPSDYENVCKEFHMRGGYNQYFYGNEWPSHINSKEFLEGLQSKTYQPDAGHMADLLQSAAIYGDAALAQFILESGEVDVNLCNQYGESLLVLCCKGGHTDLLHVLIDARVNAKSRDNTMGLLRMESALHWVVAFDDSDQKDAVSLLISAGAEVTADISWKHPLIDLPGKFPLGTAFHYATFCNSPSWVRELLHHTDEEDFTRYTNTKGSSLLTPLEYAARYHCYKVIKQLLDGRAMDNPDINALVLHEVSNLPTYESWAISGLLNVHPNKLADLCTSMFLDWHFSLLDQEDELGFTPLLMACYYHSTAVVKCLIKQGCNANAQTPFENDGRTALNMYSNNQLAYADNDILELLHVAGANLELGSASGMKPLHYAARDNNLTELQM
ncbi:hypothetical protein PILCRDRAFT_88233 [Piloderma croceum F 1598]|uniref:Protein kinase domain-containing protein n=1 Tax=Piloderma croceum (strain F 1598) TaxID=765440 RepID=A0A0C3FT61_PILCF|nr:hypothetical protein PILCRDRAFT_88233 [Piloderma croceum F 1598]